MKGPTVPGSYIKFQAGEIRYQPETLPVHDY